MEAGSSESGTSSNGDKLDRKGGDSTTREKILDYVGKHPGSHLRQIKRELDLAMGVTQYHLYALEKEQKILSRRRGLYKRFYPSLTFGAYQQEILGVLSQETERDLLLYLVKVPLSTQKELAEYAQLSAGTINWHMKRLIDASLVVIAREGQFVRYSSKVRGEEIIKLLKGYHPAIWERWADRLADALTDVNLGEADDVGKKENWD